MTDTSGAADASQQHVEGGWCWFSSPRAIEWGDCLAYGFVRPIPGSDRGAVCVAVQRFTEGVADRCEVLVLDDSMRLDDHNAPGVLEVTKDELLVGFTGHSDTNSLALRVVRRGSSGLTVASERTIDLPWVLTYVNLIRGTRPGEILIATRCGRDLHALVRTNLDSSSDWEFAPLLRHSSAADQHLFAGERRLGPYAVYRQAGPRTWIAANEWHPRHFRSGVWCAYLEGDVIYDVMDRPVRHLNWVRPDALVGEQSHGEHVPLEGWSCVVPPGGSRVPWVQDLVVDRRGMPVIGFSSTLKDAELFAGSQLTQLHSVRYHRARHCDGSWDVMDVGFGGSSLYGAECDYAGGLAINPRNPDVMALSTNVSPATGEPTWTYPDYRLFTVDVSRLSFQYHQVSRGSARGPASKGAIRPVFSEVSGGDSQDHALLYLDGDYRTYKEFDLAIRTIRFRTGLSCIDCGDRHIDLSFPLRVGEEMPEDETEVLREALSRHRDYLEYGAGGSTLIALASSVERVTSVDVDAQLLEVLALRAREAGRAEFFPVASRMPVCGPWGRPLTGSEGLGSIGQGYVEAAQLRDRPSLVLIDGRFRAACFLYVIAQVQDRTTILWDDYASRPGYFWVERYAAPRRLVGRMAEFVLDARTEVSPIDYRRALADYE